MPTKSKSSIITEANRKRSKRVMPPIHPGEMLREEFLLRMGLSANALAIAYRCARNADRRDREWTARHFGRHRDYGWGGISI